MINIRGLKKSFGDLEVLNIDQLKVHSNEIVGFIGKNGSGKTTLFKILLTLLKYNSADLYEVHLTRAGLIEQPGFFPGLSGYENLKFLLPQTSLHEAEVMIDILDIRSYIDRPVIKYSLGMKQRLALVYLFSTHKELLVLDEPTVALDKQGIEAFKKALEYAKSKGKTILVSSHEIHHVLKLCDRILLLQNGDLHPVELFKSGTYDIYMMHFKDEINCSEAIKQLALKFDYINETSIRVYLNEDLKPIIMKLMDYNLVAFYKIEDISEFLDLSNLLESYTI